MQTRCQQTLDLNKSSTILNPLILEGSHVYGELLDMWWRRLNIWFINQDRCNRIELGEEIQLLVSIHEQVERVDNAESLTLGDILDVITNSGSSGSTTSGMSFPGKFVVDPDTNEKFESEQKETSERWKSRDSNMRRGMDTVVGLKVGMEHPSHTWKALNRFLPIESDLLIR